MSAPSDAFTYDDLTEVARREQRNKTISEVRKDLYHAMVECQDRLKRESEREFSADPFSTKSKLASNQLNKFQEKASQVFEFRMDKILDMALRAAVGNRTETSRLTIEEKEIYDEVHTLLKEKRSYMLEGVRTRVAETEELSLETVTVPEMVVEAMREESEVVPEPPQEEVPESAPAPVEVPAAPEAEKVVDAPPATAAPPAEFVILRILEDIPKFVGPDRTYKLRKEDLVSLPATIAKALVARKKAVAVSLAP